MRHIGFSTGAIAKGDFHKALGLLSNAKIQSVELSALRFFELEPLTRAIGELDLSCFEYVSVHAPSSFQEFEETRVVQLLQSILAHKFPIILHPDTIYHDKSWAGFGNCLVFENMDQRKKTGRTANELAKLFSRFPDAKLCFDIGHARHVDPTMFEAIAILNQFKDRLSEVHISEVNSQGRHEPLSFAAIEAYIGVAHLIPPGIPLILESPVPPEDIGWEVKLAEAALPDVSFANLSTTSSERESGESWAATIKASNRW
jgi:hypothetical protein